MATKCRTFIASARVAMLFDGPGWKRSIMQLKTDAGLGMLSAKKTAEARAASVAETATDEAQPTSNQRYLHPLTL